MLYIVEEAIPALLLPNEPFVLRVAPISMEQVKRLLKYYKWYSLMDYRKLKRLLNFMGTEITILSRDTYDKLENYDKIIMFVFNDDNDEDEPKQTEIFPIPRKILLMQIEFFFQEHPCNEVYQEFPYVDEP